MRTINIVKAAIFFRGYLEGWLNTTPATPINVGVLRAECVRQWPQLSTRELKLAAAIVDATTDLPADAFIKAATLLIDIAAVVQELEETP